MAKVFMSVLLGILDLLERPQVLLLFRISTN
jgi:hypothetical protein